MSYLNTDLESEYNKGERLGLSASVKILDKNAYSKVYSPPELFGFIEKIYNRLGMKYDIISNGVVSDNTEMSVESSTALKMTKIIIRNAGADFEDELRQAIKDSIKQKSEMIELVLTLNSDSCPYAYEISKKCGFLLSGLIPGGEKGDYIIMQMLPGDNIIYDNLVLVDEFEELKNDIIAINGYNKEV